MRGAPIGVLLILAIAGCVGPQTDLQSGDTNSAGAPADWEQVLDGRACQTVRAYFMVDATRADPWLPPGFWPADARNIPAFVTVREGRVPALVSSTQCESGVLSEGPFSFGYAGFQVRRPVVSEVSQDATEDYYIATAFSDNNLVRAELEAAGWPVDDQRAETTVAAAAAELQLQEIREVSLNVLRSGDTVVRVSGETFYPADQEAPLLFRSWHASSAGLSYFETAPGQPVTEGTMRECSISPDSPVSTVLGPVGCDERDVTSRLDSSSSRWLAALDPDDLPMRLVAMPGWQP